MGQFCAHYAIWFRLVRSGQFGLQLRILEGSDYFGLQQIRGFVIFDTFYVSDLLCLFWVGGFVRWGEDAELGSESDSNQMTRITCRSYCDIGTMTTDGTLASYCG